MANYCKIVVMPSEKITHLLEHDHKDAPLAPPTTESSGQPHNPYDFITNPAVQPKKKLLPSGGSKTSRLIIVGLGGILFIFLATTIIGFIKGANGGYREDFASLAQQQVELIRVSDIGMTKSREAQARYLATTTKLTLISEQPVILADAKKAGAKVDAKSLSLGHDSKTDALLTSAGQANQFDQVFIKTLRAKLTKYQQTIKKVHDATSKPSVKSTLSKDYTDIGNLIGKEEKPTPTQ